MRAINKETRSNRYTTISDNICAIKDVAKDLDIPIIVLAQMSRNIEYRKGEEPELSDLRDSGEIEQEASIVLFIHNPESTDYSYLEKHEKDDINRPKICEYTQLLVKKNRNGRLGKINTIFNKPVSTFTEIDTIKPMLNWVQPENKSQLGEFHKSNINNYGPKEDDLPF